MKKMVIPTANQNASSLRGLSIHALIMEYTKAAPASVMYSVQSCSHISVSVHT